MVNISKEEKRTKLINFLKRVLKILKMVLTGFYICTITSSILKEVER